MGCHENCNYVWREHDVQALSQNIVMNKFPECCWVLYIISHYESALEITEIQNPVKGIILVAEIQAIVVIGVGKF